MKFKFFRFLFFTAILLTLTYYLNVKVGELPAIGKLLNPFNGFWQNGETADLDIPDQIKSKYLQDEASIVFDDLLIPHIYAKNDHDVYFLQGYITAYNRLFQMDFSARATAGRLSEVLGSNYLNYDRLQRRKGLQFAAERLLEEVKKHPEVYNMLLAYSEGVNAYIDSKNTKDFGVEYKLINTQPEKWSPLRSCLMLKSMADMLSRYETDLESTNFLRLYGKKAFDDLFPEYPEGIDPIIPAGTPFDFEPIVTKDVVNQLKDSSYITDFVRNTIEKNDPFNGSNNVVVGPSLTRNGDVILSNEPDLGLSLPSIWYLAHLNSDGLNVMGSTIPGMPGVIIGFNDQIAWGNTNAPRDLVDWYDITYKNEKRDEYKYDDKWLKTSKRIEKIKVFGAETFYDTVIYTHYGPVTYDETFLRNGHLNYAMRWVDHDPSLEYKAMYQINRASNYDDWVSAFQYFSGPPQNYCYGDTEGNIALWINGRFPIKWNEQGKFLMDGSDSRNEWQGFIPKSQNLHIKNPERGFVSSANQHSADSTYPYYAYNENNEYYRGRRINDRLRKMDQITVRDIQKLQNDNFNYIASDNLSFLLDMVDSSMLTGNYNKFYRDLRAWDFFNDPELVEPSVFELFQDRISYLLWDEMRDDEIKLMIPSLFRTFDYMRRFEDSDFYDIKSTEQKETMADLVNSSFQYAVDSVSNWESVNSSPAKWYLFKNTTVRHLLRIPQFSKDKVKIGGNHNIVNAASANHGPSYRMVVSLSNKGVDAWVNYPGSQTGNIGNPKYGHMIEDWAAGKYTKLIFTPESNFPNEQKLKTVNFQKK